MLKKSPVNFASVSPRALVVLLVCVAACLLVTRTLPAFLRSEAPVNLSQRTLTIAERVAYQHAIEDVHWRHRIWPKERPDPKPSLDAVMSQAQLEKKVTDYLRKSQALEDHWQRPITAEQLQAEMDRMAKHTKQPEVLRELFEAVGNDPFVIAECLARPVLAERLLTKWYTYDQTIHRELRRRAEAELKAYPTVDQMKQLSGKYSEIDLVKSDPSHEQDNHRLGSAIKLNSHEWDKTVEKLAAMFSDRAVAPGVSPAKGVPATEIKTGVLSALQEHETHYYAAKVLEKTKEHLKLATVSWHKEPLESWLAKSESQVFTAMAAPAVTYTLPKISDGAGCIDNTWTATAGPPDGRQHHTAIWTGTEMIVWGGEVYTHLSFASGGRYNPSTDTWTTPARSTRLPRVPITPQSGQELK